MAFALGSLGFLTPHPFENVGSMLDRVLERYPSPTSLLPTPTLRPVLSSYPSTTWCSALRFRLLTVCSVPTATYPVLECRLVLS